MSDAPAPQPRTFWARIGRLCWWPIDVLVFVAERALSPRGLGVMFLLLAAFLTRAGWLRPPLSPDLRSYHVPLNVRPGHAPSPEKLLHSRHRFLPLSVGTLVLSSLGVGLVLVLWRPRYRGVATGLVLTTALAGNLVAAFNNPGLIEAMDREYEQRQTLASVVTPFSESCLVTFGNGRIGGLAWLTGEEQRGDLGRGLVYLLYGQWLVLWALGGTLLATSGPLWRRLRVGASWSAAGLALAFVLCLPRLHAEYHWARALRLEGRGDTTGARQHLEQALALCPQLGRLERTWLFTGKLDVQEGRASGQERFFRSYQLARYKGTPRGRSYINDIPWVIKGAPDYRTGLMPLPSGIYAAYQPSMVGTVDFREVPALAQGCWATTVVSRAPLDQRQAREEMKDLLALVGTEHAAQQQQARLWNETAVSILETGPNFIGQHWDYNLQMRQLTYAETAADFARNQAPLRSDTALYLANLAALRDHRQPQEIDAAFAPAYDRCADALLRADVLSTVGSMYFQAGLIMEARRRFARAYDLFSLPKDVNFRAQRGLGGDL